MKRSGMFCPHCGGTDTINNGVSPNGGVLYVAEEMDFATEYYDGDAHSWKCNSCKGEFYIADGKTTSCVVNGMDEFIPGDEFDE